MNIFKQKLIKTFFFLSLFIFISFNFTGVAFSQYNGLPDFTKLVEKTSPAVVNIRTTQPIESSSAKNPRFPGIPELDENDPMYEFFRRFLPPGGQGPRQVPPQGSPSPRSQPPRGVGSGFIISSDGFILSNHHVVAGAGKVLVTMADRKEFSAKVIGSDQRTDVALLKIEGKNFPYLKMGKPSEVKVGEWVLAIGSPFGLENTVTAGIVSALGRDTGDYLPFIQTDVAVNPGNSGGPLLNLAGEVIGINSQIYSRTGGFMGISFAIPIDEANLVSDQLKLTGKVIRGRIGVLIGEVSSDVSEALGFKSAKGALIRSVDPKGPSSRANVKPGDIVLSFEGKKIERVSDLPRIVGRTKPGTMANVEIWRGGKTINIKIEVEELKMQRVASSKPKQKKPQKTSFNWLGLSVSKVPSEITKKLELKGGVSVSSVKGLAANSGLVIGDVIMSINNKNIGSVLQFSKMVEKLDKSKIIVLLIRRGEEALFIPIRP